MPDPAEYRFLRFEIVGLSTIIFLLLGIWPMLESAFVSSLLGNLEASLAIIAGFFLLSLPLGYFEHQWVVNVYRSEEAGRTVHKILKDIVLETQKSYKTKKEKPFFSKFDDVEEISFLAALLDLSIYSKKSLVDTPIFTRLSDRWSHFYARRAVGRLAPIVSAALLVMGLIVGQLLSWPLVFKWPNIVGSISIWVSVFVFCFFVIDSYSRKLQLEIGYLESAIVLSNKDEIKKIVSEIVNSLIENPEYIKQVTYYGRAIWRL